MAQEQGVAKELVRTSDEATTLLFCHFGRYQITLRDSANFNDFLRFLSEDLGELL